jgi:hypothetical protein
MSDEYGLWWWMAPGSEPEFHTEVGAETVVFLLDGTRRVRFVETQRLVGQIHEVAEDREIP